MSTATSAPMTLDVSQTARVPFSRLVSVELRKMFDTRAGQWLLISIVRRNAHVTRAPPPLNVTGPRMPSTIVSPCE